jgi:hypothetical protein
VNRRSIIRKLDSVFYEFVGSIKDEKIQTIVREKAYITGGAIVSLLKNEEPNDYDIYFIDKESAKAVTEYYLKVFENECSSISIEGTEIQENENGGIRLYIPHGGTLRADKETEDFKPYFLSSNAVSLSNDIQLIHRFYGSPEKIHDSYDFVHCTCYYHPLHKKLDMPQKALESILTNELIYTGSKYPLASIIRTRKFLKRGWNANAGQYVKMALQLGELDLTNPLVLSDQLTGVDLVLFSIVIETINEKMEADSSFKPTISYISDIIDAVFDEQLAD